MGSNLKSKVTVLIIEDELTIGEVYEDVFKNTMTEYSFDCFRFRDGNEAFEFILSETKIDIFITDLRHPGESSLALVEYMDKSHPETKTVIITGCSEHPNIDEDRYIVLQKPIDINAFTEKIRSLLNQSTNKKRPVLKKVLTVLGIIWCVLFGICAVFEPLIDLPNWALFVLIVPIIPIFLLVLWAFGGAMGSLFLDWLAVPRSREEWKRTIFKSIKVALVFAAIYWIYCLISSL